jgi:hypothetical protein
MVEIVLSQPIAHHVAGRKGDAARPDPLGRAVRPIDALA